MQNCQTLSILDLEQMSPEEIEAILSKKDTKSEESEISRDSRIWIKGDSNAESFFIDDSSDKNAVN